MSYDPSPVAANVPANVDTPDRVLYGMTARQVAILAGTAAALWLAFKTLTPWVPAVVFAIIAAPVGAVAAGIALGRRDGISMDRWILAALTRARSPRRMVAGTPLPAPAWAPAIADPHTGDPRDRNAVAAGVAPLRLPIEAIAGNGGVDTDTGRVALTAATTINFDLRSLDEQHALVSATGRWLNSLSGPVQIVVSTRRVDMNSYAAQVEDRLHQLPHPALADAAAGYAQFLRELAVERDPLDRHVLIAHHAGPDADPNHARRAAERSAAALTGLGAATRVLDGSQVADALTGACDPWRHVGTGKATPDAVITAQPDGDL
jgi:hypothetical protein